MKDEEEIKKILDEKLWNNDINIIDIILNYVIMFEEEEERIKREQLYRNEKDWIECWRNHLEEN